MLQTSIIMPQTAKIPVFKAVQVKRITLSDLIFILLLTLLFQDYANKLYIIILRTQTYASMLSSPTIHSQSQIYEDLSSFLHLFKRAIATTQHISITIPKEHERTSSLQTLKEIIEDIKHLSSKYENTSLCELIEPITFSRFAYRLIEIITNCKHKYQFITNTPIQHTFDSLLRELDLYLREGEKVKTFVQLMVFVKMGLLRFVQRLVLDEGRAKIGEDDARFKDIVRKLNEEYQRGRANDRLATNNASSFHVGSQAEKTEDNSGIHQKRTKMIITNQTFSNIQKRFDRYRGLDLDFPHFRGSHFQAKSNYDSFYKDFFQRNGSILNIITQYSDDFSSYKKRQCKYTRKSNSRLILDRGRANVTDGEMMESQIKMDVNFQEQIDEERKEPRSKGSSIVLPFTMESSKILDKMKKVYVSLGKNGKKTNNISSTVIRKKVPQSNHQSFAFGTEHKPSSEIENSVAHEAPGRFKTEGRSERYDKSSFSESKAKARFIFGDKILGYMVSPGKMELKTKYFQLNCIPPSVKSESTKNRVFLNNKFSIKHTDKSKLPNWFSQK